MRSARSHKGSKLSVKLSILLIIVFVFVYSFPVSALDHQFIHEFDPFGIITYKVKPYSGSAVHVTDQVFISESQIDDGDYKYQLVIQDPTTHGKNVAQVQINSASTYDYFLDPTDYVTYFKITLGVDYLTEFTCTEDNLSSTPSISSFATTISITGRDINNSAVTLTASSNSSNPSLVVDSTINNTRGYSSINSVFTVYLTSADIEYINSISWDLTVHKAWGVNATVLTTIKATPLTLEEVTSLEYESYLESIKTNQLLEDNLSTNQNNVDKNQSIADSMTEFDDVMNGYNQLGESLERPTINIESFDDLTGGNFDQTFVNSTLATLWDVKPIGFSVFLTFSFALVSFIVFGKKA